MGIRTPEGHSRGALSWNCGRRRRLRALGGGSDAAVIATGAKQLDGTDTREYTSTQHDTRVQGSIQGRQDPRMSVRFVGREGVAEQHDRHSRSMRRRHDRNLIRYGLQIDPTTAQQRCVD